MGIRQSDATVRRGHTFEALLGKFLPFSEKRSILPVRAELKKVSVSIQQLVNFMAVQRAGHKYFVGMYL